MSILKPNKDHPIDSELSMESQLALSLFNCLPSNPFYIKNTSLEYIAVNQAMADFCGVPEVTSILGKRSRDLFSLSASIYYDELDTRVITSKRGILSRLEPAFDTPMNNWISYSLIPVLTSSNQVTGVAGVAESLNPSSKKKEVYQRLFVVIQALKKDIGMPCSISNLANLVNISTAQLERDFNQYLYRTPKAYQTMLRMQHACNLLDTNQMIADVALACGFNDQSAFSRCFKQSFKISPSLYRRQKTHI